MSFHLATGYTTYVAFSASNLKPVVKELLNKYPPFRTQSVPLFILADWDGKNAPHIGNTGMIEAQKIYEEFEIPAIVPIGMKPDTSYDFSDMWIAGRVDEIIDAFNSPLRVFSGSTDFVGKKTLALREYKRESPKPQKTPAPVS